MSQPKKTAEVLIIDEPVGPVPELKGRPEDLQALYIEFRNRTGLPSPHKLDEVGREFYLDTIGG